MRLTEEELLKQFPNFSTKYRDIVPTMYGDLPANISMKKEGKTLKKLTRGNENTMFYKNTFYILKHRTRIYDTLIGTVELEASSKLLNCLLNIEVNGVIYTLKYTDKFGKQRLTLTGDNKGWRNSCGIPYKDIEPLDTNIVTKIFNQKLQDYGVGIQTAMKCCRKIYNKDRTNYFEER